MELLIDIGNTNISMAVASDGRIIKRAFIKSSKESLSALVFKKNIGKYSGKIEKIIVVSVCPPVLSTVIKHVKKVTRLKKVLVVGRDITVPVKNLYRNKSQVGQDRLLLAYAAGNIARKPVVIVDFGTAVTFDFLNKKGEYEGGLIFPGIRVALSSLESKAALLPEIHIRPVKGFVGKDTFGSMNNGIVYGYASLCDGLIEMFRKKHGKNINVIATGGDASLISRYSRHIKKVHPDLIFDGLINMLKTVY